jgi:ATP-dependent protease HslVU (ClpYQ) ATPase subunit
MVGILAKLFRHKNGSVRAAEVFTVAIPTVNYVARSEVENKLQREFDRCDKMICVTGPSKSGKTVVVRKMLPKTSFIIGQVGVSRSDIWRHLCAINHIPLRLSNEISGSVTAQVPATIKGSVETRNQQEGWSRAAMAFVALLLTGT